MEKDIMLLLMMAFEAEMLGKELLLFQGTLRYTEDNVLYKKTWHGYPL